MLFYVASKQSLSWLVHNFLNHSLLSDMKGLCFSLRFSMIIREQAINTSSHEKLPISDYYPE